MPPPSWLCTQTVLPWTEASQIRPFEAETMLAPSAVTLGTVTRMQPIWLNGSPLVPTRVKVVETPVVAVSGEAVSVHSSAAATWDGSTARAMAAVARAARAEDLESARTHYDAGARAYELADYHRAIEEYKASYEASPKTSTLYALGQAYRAVGELELALHSFEQYLARRYGRYAR